MSPTATAVDSRRGAWRLALASGLFLLVFVAWSRLDWGGSFATRVFVDVTSSLIPLGLGIACLRRAQGWASKAAVPMAIGLGMVAWGLGNSVWTYYEVVARVEAPFPSLADLGYVLFLPIVACALLLLVAGGAYNTSRIRTLLDGLLIGGAVLIIAHAFLLGPLVTYATQQESTLAVALSLAYPVGDFVLLSLALFVATRVDAATRRSLAWMGAGLLAFTVADVGFWYMTAQGTYATGSWTDPGWVAGFILLGAAVLWQAPRQEPRKAPANGFWLVAFPLVPFLLAVAAGAYLEVRDGAIDSFLVWTGLGLVAIVVIRQFLVVIENTALRAGAEAANSILESALESTAAGILVVDLEGRIVRHNQQFAAIWGIPSEILSTARDGVLLAYVEEKLADPADFRGKVAELYKSPLESSQDELHFKDGRIVERFSRPQILEGKPIGRVWSFRDITAQRRTEAERAEAQIQEVEARGAAEMARHRTQFINLAAHELATPLTPLRLQLHLLHTGVLGPLDERQAKAVAVAERNAQRLAGLVKEIVDVVRLQTGVVQFRVESFLPGAAVQEVAETFEDPARQIGVELDLHLEDDTPFLADRSRFMEIVSNLVSNAVKFTPPGGRVDVTVESLDTDVAVIVTDTGIGLTAHQIGNLFRPFVQMHDTSQLTAGGVGLGLYVSHGLATAMGGSITCESPGPGLGATFILTLPRRPGPLATESPAPPVRAPLPTTGLEMDRRLRELI